MKLFIFFYLISFSLFAEDFLPTSFSTDYEESFKSAASGKIKKSFGKIDYKYPKQIRLEVLNPDPSTFVANAKTSWYYTAPFIEGEEGQVVIQSSKDLALTKFLDSLKKGLKGNEAFSVTMKADKLFLKFAEKTKKQLQLQEATLTSQTSEASKVTTLAGFNQLELVHLDGKKLNFKFSNFKSNVSHAVNHFEFKIPPHTKQNKTN
ncbi:MAG: outer membrane lipoprotein carrier protein LolA [Bacteriovoracaceae bacterium]|nr:outer membrane lipoprotein carrier protein LolA [Bacteriovoracaceae bacterium]